MTTHGPPLIWQVLAARLPVERVDAALRARAAVEADAARVQKQAEATAAARLVPVGAYLKQQRPNPGSNGEDKMYSSLECTSKSAWAQVVLRSLTAINNYGIWSGHVLYWHMIPATLSWLQRNALQPDHPRRPASARLQT